MKNRPPPRNRNGRSDRPGAKPYGQGGRGRNDDRPQGRGARDDAPRGDKPKRDDSRGRRDRNDRQPRAEKPWQAARGTDDKARGPAPYRRNNDRNDRTKDRPARDRDDRGQRPDRPYKPYKKPYESDSSGRPARPNWRDERPNRDPRAQSRDVRDPRPVREPREPRIRLAATIWGLHAAREAWINPDRVIKSIYISKDMLADFQLTLDQARDLELDRPEPVLMDKADMDRALPRDAVHQGIALDAEDLPEIFVQDLIAGASLKPCSVFVILDQVTDPHNAGAILRSACAFGATGVVMQRRHAPELTGTLAKSASGAADHIPVAYETNLSRAIEIFKEAGYVVAGLDERGETAPLQGLKGHERLVLVLGAEGSGLRRLIRENCDILIALPTQKPIQSLNVSNAAAIALFAALG